MKWVEHGRAPRVAKRTSGRLQKPLVGVDEMSAVQPHGEAGECGHGAASIAEVLKVERRPSLVRYSINRHQHLAALDFPLLSELFGSLGDLAKSGSAANETDTNHASPQAGMVLLGPVCMQPQRR